LVAAPSAPRNNQIAIDLDTNDLQITSLRRILAVGTAFAIALALIV
jgi:hypothetical protein